MKVKEIEINTQKVHVSVVGKDGVLSRTMTAEAVKEEYGNKEVIRYIPYRGDWDSEKQCYDPQKNAQNKRSKLRLKK